VALLETDPVDWALDAAGDLIMPIRYTRGIEAVAQGIRIRLMLVRGEWFLDLDAGIPYLPGNGVDPTIVILGERFDRVRAESAFRAAILRTPGVGRIVSLGIEFSSATRVMNVAVKAQTLWGDTVDVLQAVPELPS
jgi:hypothetical protein